MEYSSLIASGLQAIAPRHSQLYRSSSIGDLLDPSSGRAGASSSHTSQGGQPARRHSAPKAGSSTRNSTSMPRNSILVSSSHHIHVDEPQDMPQSYLSLDDDSESDYDELDDLSDWSFIEFHDSPTPLPRLSITPVQDKSSHQQSFFAFGHSPADSPIIALSHEHFLPSIHTICSTLDAQLMKELSVKELEPIVSFMEPAIAVDDGSQGDWRQVVDDYIEDEKLGTIVF